MLILTGGLVLGETMALWMTAKEECFGLAAVLLVLACIKLADSWCMQKGRRLAAALLFLAGWIIGAFRMEWEEMEFDREWGILAESGQDATNERDGGDGQDTICEQDATDEFDVVGEIAEITKTEYGYRLILKECTASKKKIRRMFCYLEKAENLKLGMKVQLTGELELPERAGNPGQFDFRSYCRAKGISLVLKGKSLEILSSRYLWMQENLRRFGMICAEKIDLITESSDTGILKAVLLGNKADLDQDIYEIYRKNGISHVLAISGLHVSMIGMGLWKGLRKAGMGYCSAGAAAFFILFSYGSVTGFGPSVVRAVFMMGLSFLAGVFGRTYDVPIAICVPAAGLLMVRPFLLTQASFQLSFLAVGAICFPGEYLAKKWNLCDWKKDILFNGSIQLVTMPVVLFHSFEIPPYGILLNFAVVPLMTYVLVSGLAALAVSFFSLSAARFCLGGAHYILGFYQWICEAAGDIPGAGVVLGRPSLTGICLFYIIVLCTVYLSVRKSPRWLALVCVGILFLPPVGKQGLRVTFLDVGQGDGIFLQADGYTMLVDCGSSRKREIGKDCLIPFLKYKGICRVDTVVVSHVDEDHVSGIRYLLETSDCGIVVGMLVLPDDGELDEEEKNLIRLAEMRGIPVTLKRKGDSLSGVLGEQVRIDCLHPVNGGRNDRNENSLVLQVEYGEFRMLLTGDAGEEAERMMVQGQGLESVTVLKAGHHGSASSSGQVFLETIQPAYVILSYGAGNQYGHPAASVLDRCEAIGAQVYATPELGAIEVWTDGNFMQIGGWFDRRNGI